MALMLASGSGTLLIALFIDRLVITLPMRGSCLERRMDACSLRPPMMDPGCL